MRPESKWSENARGVDGAVHVTMVHGRVGRDAHPHPVQQEHVGIIFGPESAETCLEETSFTFLTRTGIPVGIDIIVTMHDNTDIFFLISFLYAKTTKNSHHIQIPSIAAKISTLTGTAVPVETVKEISSTVYTEAIHCQ